MPGIARLFKVYVCVSVNACENVCLRGMRLGERERERKETTSNVLLNWYAPYSNSQKEVSQVYCEESYFLLSLSLTLLIPLSPLLLSHFLFPCLIFHSLKDPERSWEPRELEIAGSGIPSLREAFLERRAKAYFLWIILSRSNLKISQAK